MCCHPFPQGKDRTILQNKGLGLLTFDKFVDTCVNGPAISTLSSSQNQIKRKNFSVLNPFLNISCCLRVTSSDETNLLVGLNSYSQRKNLCQVTMRFQGHDRRRSQMKKLLERGRHIICILEQVCPGPNKMFIYLKTQSLQFLTVFYLMLVLHFLITLSIWLNENRWSPIKIASRTAPKESRTPRNRDPLLLCIPE